MHGGWFTQLLPLAVLVSTFYGSSADILEPQPSQIKAAVPAGLKAEFRMEIDTMDGYFANLTDTISNVAALHAAQLSGESKDMAQLKVSSSTLLALRRKLDSLQQMSLDTFDVGDKYVPPRINLLPEVKLELESEEIPDHTNDIYCDNDGFIKTLIDSTNVLRNVILNNVNLTTLDRLNYENSQLATFITDCTFHFIDRKERNTLLKTIQLAQDYIAPAAAAVAPSPEPGVAINSTYMVLFLALTVLLAFVLLVGLAVLGYVHAQGSAAGRPGQKLSGQPPLPLGGVSGETNPAFAEAGGRPAAPLNETENWRWRLQGAAEPRRDADDPVTTRNAKKSTWGRIWGGVVKDYQQHSPISRAPEPAVMVPRPHARPAAPAHGLRQSAAVPHNQRAPRQRDVPHYGDEDEAEVTPKETRPRGWSERRSPPPRRQSPPHRRQSPPPRRQSPPPRRQSPPPRRQSPPPRRQSPPPLGRPSPNTSDGGNWSYGASGRNKSTDSPFTSAW